MLPLDQELRILSRQSIIRKAVFGCPLPGPLRIIQPPGLQQVTQKRPRGTPIAGHTVPQDVFDVVNQARVFAEDDRIVVGNELQNPRGDRKRAPALSDQKVKVRHAQQEWRHARRQRLHPLVAVPRLFRSSRLQERLPKVRPAIGVVRIPLENRPERADRALQILVLRPRQLLPRAPHQPRIVAEKEPAQDALRLRAIRVGSLKENARGRVDDQNGPKNEGQQSHNAGKEGTAYG
jgi:hypothetical protein